VLRTGLRWLSTASLLVFFLFPLYALLMNALEAPADAEAVPMPLLPRHLYWGNFAALLRHFPFGRNLLNSLVVAGSTTLLVLLLATGAAYALARLPLPGRRALLVLVVLLLCFPSIALVASLYLALRATGWLNTYLALIVPYCALWTPLAVWVLSAAFRQVPVELCAQAETDGCTALQVLGRVVLPLAAPALSAAALLVFIGAWGEYLLALTFLFQPEMLPLSVVMEGVGVGHGIDSAAVVLVTVPLSVLVALAQNHLIRGLQAAAGR
jgi:multiple sugar transport system permease protein